MNRRHQKTRQCSQWTPRFNAKVRRLMIRLYKRNLLLGRIVYGFAAEGFIPNPHPIIKQKIRVVKLNPGPEWMKHPIIFGETK